MKRCSVVLFILGLLAAACGESDFPFKEPLSGFSNTGESESYNRGTLYSYMDGGAELYLEYGFSTLDVRRYARGAERYVVELYWMKDEESASAIYTYTRHAGKEGELLPGCVAGITPSEIQLARGIFYLVCRNEDPMAKRSPGLPELARQLAERLPGHCEVGDLFARLPVEKRVAGSEIALFGPIALNARPWLASLSKEGFSRGWLASYALSAGQAETLLAEYATTAEANRAVADFKKSQEPDVLAEQSEESVVLVRAPGVPRDELGSLVSSLLSAPKWR